MDCYVKLVNTCKTNGRTYCFKNVGQAKLVALVNLRKFGGVAIIKIAGKGRHHFVLSPDNKLVEIHQKNGQEYVYLIEENVDLRAFGAKSVEIIEHFYSVPEEPATILFKLEEEKKPSLWQKIVNTVKSWF